MARGGWHDGKLGGQDRCGKSPGCGRTDGKVLNSMASNLTAQVVRSPKSPSAVPAATYPRKSPWTYAGEILQLKEASIRVWWISLRSFASEVDARGPREVGHRRQAWRQALVPGVAGTWKDLNRLE